MFKLLEELYAELSQLEVDVEFVKDRSKRIRKMTAHPYLIRILDDLDAAAQNPYVGCWDSARERIRSYIFT
ncbi:hypothetical protein GF360_03660 [candidate division WWE3 bacterium]|nr:hypothetical protein [candidate division WWE3 bacterium]